MIAHAYHVPDITCQHCVNSITQELSKIPGVRHIDINLEEKRVTVESDAAVTETQLRSGIENAGYDITL